MEITLENKAKFFALYWGQKVMRCKTFNVTTGKGLSGLMYVDINSETIKENWFLELNPLSSISYEDLEMIDFNFPDGTDGIEFDFQPDNYRFHWKVKRGINIIEGYLTLKNFDYLRSRGYALPFMGLSVEELVNRGWVKLKGGKK